MNYEMGSLLSGRFRLTLQAAHEGMVLLKNDGLLPQEEGFWVFRV